jgi:hypothetical protein
VFGDSTGATLQREPAWVRVRALDQAGNESAPAMVRR